MFGAIKPNGSEFIREPVRILKVLAVIRRFRTDKEVVVVKDLVQSQYSVHVVVGSGKQVVDLILKKK